MTCLMLLTFPTFPTSLYDFAYHSLSHSSIGFIVACATSTNSLSSALSSCDTYLIRSVTPYLDVFYTVYINNILVYNNNLTKYKKHVNFILKALRGASL